MRIRIIVPVIVALTLLVPGLSQAASPDDVLAALQARLEPLVAHTPVTATLDINETHHNGSGDKATTRNGHITLQLRSDDKGLTVQVPATEFERTAAASKASTTDADVDTTSSGMLKSYSLSTGQAMLDFAPVLKQILAVAKPTGQKPVVRNGKPAHLLSFDMPMSPGAKKDSDLKDFSSTVELWLDAEGTPLEVRSQIHNKYRKFLINFSMYSKQSCKLEVMGDRLICLTRHEESGGSGMGESGKSATDSKLTAIHGVSNSSGSQQAAGPG